MKSQLSTLKEDMWDKKIDKLNLFCVELITSCIIIKCVQISDEADCEKELSHLSTCRVESELLVQKCDDYS